VLLSVREDGGVPAAWAGTGGDERPYAVLPDRYQVEAAAERDRDGIPAGGTAVGEPGGFVDPAASPDRPDAVERARARGDPRPPGAVLPGPPSAITSAAVSGECRAVIGGFLSARRRAIGPGHHRDPATTCHTSAASPDPGRPENAYVREDKIVPHLPALHLLRTGHAAVSRRRRTRRGTDTAPTASGPDVLGYIREHGIILIWNPAEGILQTSTSGSAKTAI
jgi:hypothetical protein